MLQTLHYLTIFFSGLNIFLLARAFLRYLRYRKSGIPALGYCLAFLLSALLFSLAGTVCFLLPEGRVLRVLAVVAAWLTLCGNVLFALIVASAAGPSGGRSHRRLRWLMALPLAALPLYLTNGRHHLMMGAVDKQADGFLFDAVPGPLNPVINLFILALILGAALWVFLPRSPGHIRELRIRLLMVGSLSLSLLLNLLEALVPLLHTLRFSMFFTWLPATVLCHIFFGYLLTSRQRAIDEMTDAYVVYDLRGSCVDINPRAEAFFRRYSGAGRPDAARFAKLLGREDITGTAPSEVALAAGGEVKHYRVSPFRLGSGIGRYGGRGYIIREITDFVTQMSQLNTMATEDPLTGAKNRRYMDETAGALLARAMALGRPLTVLMLDLDFFKRVNDRYGHAVGDDVLRAAYGVFSRNVREEDLVIRYGGEEFVVLSEGADAADGRRMAERIRAAVEASPFLTSGGAVHVTVSIGAYTAVPKPGHTLEWFIERADHYMYKAKQNGRNRAEFGDEDEQDEQPEMKDA